jgi:hypothetical protein
MCSFSNRITSIVFILVASASAAQSTEIQRSIIVPGRGVIQLLSTAPKGENVAGYLITPAEEITSGTPFVIMPSGTSKPRIVKLPNMERTNPEALVWSLDGRGLFLGKNQGIYYWPLNGVPYQISNCVNAGLALSADGKFLAFWDLGEDPKADSFCLVVIDIASKREIRRWKLEARYSGDIRAFDLFFAKDAHILYARTFDADDTRPVKSFDVDTGSVSTVTTDSLSLAGNADGAFFIERKGNRYLLEQIVGKRDSKVIDPQFPVTRVQGNRNSHLLITATPVRGCVWLYDTLKRKIQSVPINCTWAAVFNNGRLLFSRGNKLLLDNCSK